MKHGEDVDRQHLPSLSALHFQSPLSLVHTQPSHLNDMVNHTPIIIRVIRRYSGLKQERKFPHTYKGHRERWGWPHCLLYS